MLFLESFARPLMIVHGIAAAVLVAAATHHLLWTRGYLRNDYRKLRGERIFAAVVACAFVTTFLLGNLLYPTYKVRVRQEFFESPSAVAAEMSLRAHSRALLEHAPPARLTSPPDLSWVAHLFDVKENWVALGCAASLLLLLLSRRAHPRQQPQVLALYFGLSVLVCATAWWGAIVGLITVSYRALGGLA